MNTIYLDTNIFVYSSQANSPFFSKCNNLLEYSLKKNIDLATSTETIQEIIHLSKKTKKITTGLKTANTLLELIQLLLPVDKETINLSLVLLKKYAHLKQVESRDFIHIASSLRYKINTLITYDKGFKQFKELESLTPDEFLRSFNF